MTIGLKIKSFCFNLCVNKGEWRGSNDVDIREFSMAFSKSYFLIFFFENIHWSVRIISDSFTSIRLSSRVISILFCCFQRFLFMSFKIFHFYLYSWIVNGHICNIFGEISVMFSVFEESLFSISFTILEFFCLINFFIKIKKTYMDEFPVWFYCLW